MDLAFTPEEQTFREDIRAWVRASLPQDIAHKVHNALHLTRDDMQRLLAEVWRTTRKTVIYVTHNVAEAVYLADRVLVMTPHPGRVKCEVTITLPRPRDPLSIPFLECQKDLLRHLGGGHDRDAETNRG